MRKTARTTLPGPLTLGIGLTLIATTASAQLVDRTQSPNIANAGIALSLFDEIGAGRGDINTPNSSAFIIARDPFRAIRRDELRGLGMKELTYGWNLEMLMRVAAARLPALEIAVGQRRRIGGVSKVSGNLIAGVNAAWSISATFVRLALELRHQKPLAENSC